MDKILRPERFNANSSSPLVKLKVYSSGFSDNVIYHSWIHLYETTFVHQNTSCRRRSWAHWTQPQLSLCAPSRWMRANSPDSKPWLRNIDVCFWWFFYLIVETNRASDDKHFKESGRKKPLWTPAVTQHQVPMDNSKCACIISIIVRRKLKLPIYRRNMAVNLSGE